MRSVAVIELADVFRRFADGYLSAHGTAMPASHRRAIADILACRTEALGGHLWRCDRCSHEVFSYHSCKNRSCPKCHTKQAKDWLDARKAEILPTDYFHVTITVPQELRALLRANQRDGYALLMKAAADAIIELAHDRRFVGGTVGVLAVLHTWTQQLVYHPHVHCLVTGGGISDDGRDWSPARKAFLVPHMALAKLVRGKLKAMLANKRPDLVTPATAWAKPWIVHINHWGQGHDAVLRYLARYVFRVAITNTRIVALDDHTVTIRYKKRKSSRWRTCRMPATNSFAVSSSTFCPKACTRSAILAFGILPNVSTPLRHASSWNSNAQLLRRSPTRAPPSPPNRGAVHVAAAATSSTSAGSRPKMPSDHDPLFPLPGSIVLIVRVLEAPQPSRPADPIIFPSPFNKRSNHLRCPATALIKSVATPHSALVSAKP